MDTDVSTRLQRIAELAESAPQMAFRNLAHHLDVPLLKRAYDRTRKDGATGVDGQTADEYAARLEDNLEALIARLKSGRYRAPPVRRVHIPKGSGSETRPIGIPTFEDKILQRAVTMILEAIYEQDFLDCSYGFRPGRSAHDALKTLWKETMDMDGGWVLDVDIENYFDSVDHGHLRSFLDQRVQDKVLRRLIGKWLKAGVMEEGKLRHPDTGTPQGGVISPLLANVYLHEVVDRWFEDQVRPRLRGPARLVRYADDLVIVCRLREDAERVMEVLPKRLSRYGLTLHPDKTRMVYFERPPRRGDPRGHNAGGGRPGTFDFMGFTHFWSRSKRGNWVVKRKTARNRFHRAVSRIDRWCRDNRHLPVAEQRRKLRSKLNGHYRYYGITGNYRSLDRFHFWVHRAWHKWLSRRGSKPMLWSRFQQILRRLPLPRPRIAHAV